MRHICVSSVHMGFNEAEAFTPRIRDCGFCLCDTLACFNEAEAFTPRIRVHDRCLIVLIYSFNEAEAFTPRIRNLRRCLRSFSWNASMRPRLLHLGYRSSLASEGVNSVASMRPRLLHLGYALWIVFLTNPFIGFNEAEAFTPRIHDVLRTGRAGPDRFNEAEAFTPRILT